MLSSWTTVGAESPKSLKSITAAAYCPLELNVPPPAIPALTICETRFPGEIVEKLLHPPAGVMVKKLLQIKRAISEGSAGVAVRVETIVVELPKPVAAVSKSPIPSTATVT
jgi:hypothetical protein